MTDLFSQQALPGDFLAPTRRHFLRDCSMGLGAMALASLSAEESLAGEGEGFEPFASRQPHFAPAVKNVIFLHMAGSPPHLDLFDYKPELVKHSGEPCPKDYLEGRRFAFTSGVPKLLGTPRKFKRYGEGGIWMSDALPKLSAMADDLTVIKSMHTEQFNHAPAQMMLYTGSPRMGRPSMGAWATYGLGSESRNLPAFIVLVSGGSNPSAGKTAWGSGFLPSSHQGVKLRSSGEPVLYLNNPPGIDRDARRGLLDGLKELNDGTFKKFADPETQSRIKQYEMAFRMQAEVPDLMDISKEPKHVKDLYGPAVEKPGSFARNCLLARRMAEKGVRFLQLFHRGWDQHGSLPSKLRQQCEDIDQPCAGLIKDLKERGMFEDTLVICGGEFGRTIYSQGKLTKDNHGRDHHGRCFTTWMAGAGIKRGFEHGKTDSHSYNILQDPVHIRDLNATILQQLGIHHEKLTFRYQGLDQRLTGR